MRKRVVYIVGDLSYPNGMSRVLSQKVNYLASHTDYELYVVLTEKASSPLYYELNPDIKWVNFDINFDSLYQLPFFRRILLFYYKKRLYQRQLSNYLCQLRPDITVSVLRREIDFLNDIHDGSRKVGELHFNRQTYRTFERWWLPNFVNHAITRLWQKKLEHEILRLDRFVVLTKEDCNNWIGFPNVNVIPNPIYSYPDIASTCENKQAIAVGRYTYQKGFDILINAWVMVKKRHPDWILKIFGAGNADVYKQLVAKNDLEGVIFCECATDDVYAQYARSSIFILSSRYEGLPLVLIEAMASGLPSVAFACPCGPRDCISDGEDGILVENGNSIELANSICYLIEHDIVRVAYGTAARRNALRFMEDNIMLKWIEMFDSL